MCNDPIGFVTGLPRSAFPPVQFAIFCGSATLPAWQEPCSRPRRTMALIFLLLFPVLLMHRPRYAFASMAIAIVLLYRGRMKSATQKARRRVDEEVYSSQI
jgi:hypothetical protein